MLAVLKGVLQQLGSDATAGVRRTVAIIVIIAAVAFLAFIVWITLQYRAANAWPEIREVVDPIVSWTLLAVVTACAAVIVDGAERRHAVSVAQAQAATAAAGAQSSAAVVVSNSVVVSSWAWRGTALGGLAVVAFSLALVSSSRLGHLRSTTMFGLREKPNVAACAAHECTAAEQQQCSTTACPNVDVQACTATLWAPSIATTADRVPIDLSVYCKDAPPQQMPNASASFGPDSGGSTSANVVTSFADAKTLRQNERVWRWFVTFASGEQPLDVRLTFVGDRVAVPLSRIDVSSPTTLASLQEQTTALGGLLGAVIGVLGTLGSLFKSWRSASSTVVAPQQNS